MKKTTILFFSMMLTILFTISCNKDETTTASTAKVLFVHASPNAPNIDILVDDKKVNSAAIAYSANSNFLTLNEGTRTIKINQSSNSTLIKSASIPFVKNKNYTVFAIDSLSKLSTLIVEDNFTTPATGKSNVRFVHLVPNAPAVDITLKSGTDSITISNKSFKQYSDITLVDSKSYEIKAKLAGTQNVVFATTGVNLSSTKSYTIWAKGFLGGTGAQALGVQVIVY